MYVLYNRRLGPRRIMKNPTHLLCVCEASTELARELYKPTISEQARLPLHCLPEWHTRLDLFVPMNPLRVRGNCDRQTVPCSYDTAQEAMLLFGLYNGLNNAAFDS